MPFVYILRCADESLYVGWTDDVDARVAAHNEGRGGRYTRRRRPVALAFVESHPTSESARDRERQLKGWSAAKKESLINGDTDTLMRLSVSYSRPKLGQTS
jgi:putative endonuclease